MLSRNLQLFNESLELVKGVLLAVEVKEKLDSLGPVFPGPIVPRIKQMVSERIDRVIEAAKPLLIVYVTACLEHYLSNVGEKQRLADMIERWRKVAGDRLATDMHEMRIIRNVIIHNAQVVDDEAFEDFRRHGIIGYKLGERLELSVDKVREFMSEAKEFAESIEAHLKSKALNG